MARRGLSIVLTLLSAPGSQSEGGKVAGGAVNSGVRRAKKIHNDNSLYARVFNFLLSCGHTFTYDMFRDQCLCDNVLIDSGTYGVLRRWYIDSVKINKEGKDASLKIITEAVEALCYENRFDSEIDYLTSLEWDGVRRLDTWLMDYFDATDTPLHRAYGRKFMIGKVRRGLFPGCKFDTALIIEGKTGLGKSEFARLLAGSDDRFTDQPIIHEKLKEQQELMAGITVVELGEVADFKRGDRNRINAFMSRRFDKARRAYAHSPINQPRRCVFVGTTEEGQYLPNEYNRRAWSFKANKRIDHDAFKLVRGQLHAEAVVMVVKNGEDCVLPETLWKTAARAQRQRRVVEPKEDVIYKAINRSFADDHQGMNDDYVPDILEIDFKSDQIWFVSSDDLMSGVLSTPKAQQHGAAGRQLQDIMKRLGWSYERVRIGIVHTTYPKANPSSKTKPKQGNPRGFIRKVGDGEFDPGWLEDGSDDNVAT
jgi:hypothetical protein